MGEIVNLRTIRKRKERHERERLAAENRARHGQSKAQRLAARSKARQAASALDGHLREPHIRDGD